MNKKRLRKWLDVGIEPNSTNIYALLLGDIQPEDINTIIDTKALIEILIEKRQKWDRKIDKIITNNKNYG